MTSNDLPGDLAWAEQTLRQRFGSSVRVEQVVQIPARTGRLHRFDVLGSQGRQRYFLKRYTPAAGTRWDAHADHLRLIAAAVGDEAGLLAYGFAGADASRQLALAAEMPGVQLTRAADQEQVWHGVGRWLAKLHAATPTLPSAARAAELVAYMEPRFRQWMERDPARTALGGRAMDAAALLPSLLRRGVGVALCHGDVTPANIRVNGPTVGLIDFDDVRIDMPGLDLSQAELTIDELSRGWMVMRPRIAAARVRAAFRAGYGPGYVDGPAFWLPHLRNLAVFLTTMAGQRQAGLWSRLDVGSRYRRTIAELERTIAAVTRAAGAEAGSAAG